MDKTYLLEPDYKAISPEWLEARGFILVNDSNKDDLHIWDLQYPINEGDLLYVENKIDRKQFAIVLTPMEYTDNSIYFDFNVLIRDDIGCGFIQIPNQFCEMTEYHFSLLFEAIRREKLEEKPKVITNREQKLI